VVVTLLPAATALAAVLFAGERPGLVFWLAALSGLLIVLAFTLAQAGGGLVVADLFLLIAVATCAVGYAQGGVLSRELGGARTISWALVLSVPVTLPIALVSAATVTPGRRRAGVGGLRLRVGDLDVPRLLRLVRRAGAGGVARVGQVQLTQPLMTLGWSALVLGEVVGPWTFATALAVLASVVVTQRARVRQDAAPCPSTTRPSASPIRPRPTPSAARR
jgi:drug/metabolite transporter (DMT)-like permease